MDNKYLNNKIKKRIFIVGCPRSGTTLLQSILISHSKIKSFPETHFFSFAYPSNKIKNFFTWPALNCQRAIDYFLLEIDRLDLRSQIPRNIFIKNYSFSFISLLDQLALESNKNIWIEKTPRHLHVIDKIKKQLPNAYFIHLIRHGKENISSLYDVKNKFSQKWRKGYKVKGKSLTNCTNRWINDISISKKYIGLKNNYFINYEQLIENPDQQIKELYDFIDIKYKNLNINNRNFSNVIGNNEPWKDNNKKTISRQKSKFETIFSLKEQEFVKKKIEKINIDKIFRF